jgi:hypothetical protein
MKNEQDTVTAKLKMKNEKYKNLYKLIKKLIRFQSILFQGIGPMEELKYDFYFKKIKDYYDNSKINQLTSGRVPLENTKIKIYNSFRKSKFNGHTLNIAKIMTILIKEVETISYVKRITNKGETTPHLINTNEHYFDIFYKLFGYVEKELEGLRKIYYDENKINIDSEMVYIDNTLVVTTLKIILLCILETIKDMKYKNENLNVTFYNAIYEKFNGAINCDSDLARLMSWVELLKMTNEELKSKLKNNSELEMSNFNKYAFLKTTPKELKLILEEVKKNSEKLNMSNFKDSIESLIETLEKRISHIENIKEEVTVEVVNNVPIEKEEVVVNNNSTLNISCIPKKEEKEEKEEEVVVNNVPIEEEEEVVVNNNSTLNISCIPKKEEEEEEEVLNNLQLLEILEKPICSTVSKEALDTTITSKKETQKKTKLPELTNFKIPPEKKTEEYLKNIDCLNKNELNQINNHKKNLEYNQKLLEKINEVYELLKKFSHDAIRNLMDHVMHDKLTKKLQVLNIYIKEINENIKEFKDLKEISNNFSDLEIKLKLEKILNDKFKLMTLFNNLYREILAIKLKKDNENKKNFNERLTDLKRDMAKIQKDIISVCVKILQKHYPPRISYINKNLCAKKNPKQEIYIGDINLKDNCNIDKLELYLSIFIEFIIKSIDNIGIRKHKKNQLNMYYTNLQIFINEDLFTIIQEYQKIMNNNNMNKIMVLLKINAAISYLCVSLKTANTLNLNPTNNDFLNFMYTYGMLSLISLNDHQKNTLHSFEECNIAITNFFNKSLIDNIGDFDTFEKQYNYLNKLLLWINSALNQQTDMLKKLPWNINEEIFNKEIIDCNKEIIDCFNKEIIDCNKEIIEYIAQISKINCEESVIPNDKKIENLQQLKQIYEKFIKTIKDFITKYKDFITKYNSLNDTKFKFLNQEKYTECKQHILFIISVIKTIETHEKEKIFEKFSDAIEAGLKEKKIQDFEIQDFEIQEKNKL